MMMQKANQHHPAYLLLETNYEPRKNQQDMINIARQRSVHQAHLLVDIIA